MLLPFTIPIKQAILQTEVILQARDGSLKENLGKGGIVYISAVIVTNMVGRNLKPATYIHLGRLKALVLGTLDKGLALLLGEDIVKVHGELVFASMERFDKMERFSTFTLRAFAGLGSPFIVFK